MDHFENPSEVAKQICDECGFKWDENATEAVVKNRGYITKEQWKDVEEVLTKYKIPYTVRWDNEDKYIQINLVIADYFA